MHYYNLELIIIINPIINIELRLQLLFIFLKQLYMVYLEHHISIIILFIL